MATKGGLNGKLLFVILAAAVGSGFQHGYHTGVINVPEKIIKDWLKTAYTERTQTKMSETTVSLVWSIVTSAMNVGGTFGGVSTGLISKTFGPKNSLILNNIFVLIATICMGLAKSVGSFEILIVGRLIIGVNCGLNAGLCPMYLSEISPVNLRGAIASVYQLVITISILMSQIFGLKELLGTDSLWPYLFIFPIVFGIFQVVTLLFCPESPRYLVGAKGANDKAQQALKFLRNSEDVSEDLNLIKSEDEAVKALPKITIKDMFSEKYLRKPLLIAIMLMLGQQFSGINAVIFYSTNTFKQSGLGEKSAQLATVGIGVVIVLMTVVSVFLVEKAGRKTLLLTSFGGMAITTLGLTFSLEFSTNYNILPYIAIALVFIYIMFFAAAAGSIPWFMVSEIFNQAARPTAVSMAVPTNWMANFIVTLTFPSIEVMIGPFVFLIFVVLNILFTVFIWAKVPETKNRTVDDIISQWK